MPELTTANHDAREGRIGSSEIGAIAGLHPTRNIWDVWAQRKGLITPDPDSPALWWGRHTEEAIAKRYSIETGHKIEPNEKTFTDGIIAATPDYFAYDENGEKYILEIKLGEGFGSGWDAHESGTDNAPLHVIAQVIWQMAATGIKRAVIAAKLPGYGPLACYPVEWDQELFLMLHEVGYKFIEDEKAGNEPVPDASDACRISILSRVKKDGIIRKATEEDDDLIIDLIEASEQEKFWKDKADIIKAKLAASLREGERGIKSTFSSFSVSNVKETYIAGYTRKAYNKINWNPAKTKY